MGIWTYWKSSGERNADNQQQLKGVRRKDVAQIYLFFDYDGHATLADDDDMARMLAHFDNETENGKLYVSYPMAEALKHWQGFQDSVAYAKAKTACDHTGPSLSFL